MTVKSVKQVAGIPTKILRRTLDKTRRARGAMPSYLPWLVFTASIISVLAVRMLHGTLPTPVSGSYDMLLEASRPGFSPSLLALSFFANLGFSMFLPLILGVINFWLLSIIIPQLMNRDDQNVARLALLLAAISPLMIATHTAHNTQAFVLLFSLILFGAYVRKNSAGDAISLFASACVILVDPIAGSLLVLLLGLRALIAKRRRLGVIMAVGALLGAGLLIRGLPAVNLLRDGIGEFGGLFGHSIFVLILALIGVALCWSSIDKMRALTTIGLVSLSFPVPGLRPVALVFVVI
jgi:hypothetical protein